MSGSIGRKIRRWWIHVLWFNREFQLIYDGAFDCWFARRRFARHMIRKMAGAIER